MTTLTNSFHGTETRVRSEQRLRQAAEAVWKCTATATDRAFLRRVRNALCGSDTCTCSGPTGER